MDQSAKIAELSAKKQKIHGLYSQCSSQFYQKLDELKVYFETALVPYLKKGITVLKTADSLLGRSISLESVKELTDLYSTLTQLLKIQPDKDLDVNELADSPVLLEAQAEKIENLESMIGKQNPEKIDLFLQRFAELGEFAKNLMEKKYEPPEQIQQKPDIAGAVKAYVNGKTPGSVSVYEVLDYLEGKDIFVDFKICEKIISEACRKPEIKPKTSMSDLVLLCFEGSQELTVGDIEKKLRDSGHLNSLAKTSASAYVGNTLKKLFDSGKLERKNSGKNGRGKIPYVYSKVIKN